ncbi:hypothetical protein ABK040_007597 [Willaertia magna]
MASSSKAGKLTKDTEKKGEEENLEQLIKQFTSFLKAIEEKCNNDEKKVATFDEAFWPLWNSNGLLSRKAVVDVNYDLRKEAKKIIEERKKATLQWQNSICGLTYIKDKNGRDLCYKEIITSKVGEYFVYEEDNTEDETSQRIKKEFSSAPYFKKLIAFAGEDNGNGSFLPQKNGSYIYAALIKLNGVFYVYIGETVSVGKRWSTTSSSHGRRIGDAFTNPSNDEELKYIVMAAAGPENILVFILNDNAGSNKERKQKEREYLKTLFGVDYYRHTNCLNVL